MLFFKIYQHLGFLKFPMKLSFLFWMLLVIRFTFDFFYSHFEVFVSWKEHLVPATNTWMGNIFSFVHLLIWGDNTLWWPWIVIFNIFNILESISLFFVETVSHCVFYTGLGRIMPRRLGLQVCSALLGADCSHCYLCSIPASANSCCLAPGQLRYGDLPLLLFFFF